MTDHKYAEDVTPWQRFETAMRQIVAVPHSVIKAKLEAESKTRKRKRTHKAKIAAFRAANPKG